MRKKFINSVVWDDLEKVVTTLLLKKMSELERRKTMPSNTLEMFSFKKYLDVHLTLTLNKSLLCIHKPYYNYPSQLDEKLKDTMSTTRNTSAGGSASVECRLFDVKKLNTTLEMGMKKYPVSLKDTDLAKISENLWINWALSYLKTPVIIPQYLDVINPISSGLNGDERFATTAEFIKNKSQLNNFVMNILKNKDIKYFDNKPWKDKNLFLSGGRLFQNQIHSY